MNAPESVGFHRDLQAVPQSQRQEMSLIVAAALLPLASQRHRHQQIRRPTSPIIRLLQPRSHDLGQATIGAVL
jgi:hypothetical protein